VRYEIDTWLPLAVAAANNPAAPASANNPKREHFFTRHLSFPPKKTKNPNRLTTHFDAVLFGQTVPFS